MQYKEIDPEQKKRRSKLVKTHVKRMSNSCQTQIKHLARQMNPSNLKFIEEAFEDATNARAHCYLVFDLRQLLSMPKRKVENRLVVIIRVPYHPIVFLYAPVDKASQVTKEK